MILAPRFQVVRVLVKYLFVRSSRSCVVGTGNLLQVASKLHQATKLYKILISLTIAGSNLQVLTKT